MENRKLILAAAFILLIIVCAVLGTVVFFGSFFANWVAIYQTLIAAVLASISAILTGALVYFAAHAQIDDQRNARLEKLRQLEQTGAAVLVSALGDLGTELNKLPEPPVNSLLPGGISLGAFDPEEFRIPGVLVDLETLSTQRPAFTQQLTRFILGVMDLRDFGFQPSPQSRARMISFLHTLVEALSLISEGKDPGNEIEKLQKTDLPVFAERRMGSTN